MGALGSLPSSMQQRRAQWLFQAGRGRERRGKLTLVATRCRHPLAMNPVLQHAVGMPPVQAANLLAVSAIQLLGEELVAILPLLVLVSALHRSGMCAWLAIGIGWVATSLAFGALHLLAYRWYFGQALRVIGAARLVLAGVYLLTRNLWASTLAHVVNDGLLIASAVFFVDAGAHAG